MMWAGESYNVSTLMPARRLNAAFLLFAIGFPLAQEPTFRSASNVVFVPALVKDQNGGIVYGLTAKDFIVEDDGVAKEVRLDESVDSEPVALVVAMQVGRRAKREFPRVRGLGAMLGPVLGQQDSKAAIVEFDSAVRLTRNFTGDDELLKRDLENLEEGNPGAAILDAIQYSIQLLRNTPSGRRRVLLLISETRDQGSKIARLDDVVASVGDSNITIYALAFSPSWSQVLDTERGSNKDEWGNGPDLLAPLLMARQSLRRNTPKKVAEMTGGEYQLFATRKAFEHLVTEFTNHIHARYALSFQPEDPRPGLHRLRVRLANPGKNTVQARSSYWAVGESN
jgi:VWFA-related protein